MNISYIRSGDYYIPDLKLEEENRPIGKWGRQHRDYPKEYHPVQINNLVLSGNLWTYLADLNEQAHQRMETLIGNSKFALQTSSFSSSNILLSLCKDALAPSLRGLSPKVTGGVSFQR